MPKRSSVQVKAKDARKGIAAAQAAGDFEPAPSRVKGGSRGRGDYGADDLKSARKGPLSNRMQEVFSRDTQLDPGVREVRIRKGDVDGLRDYLKESKEEAGSEEVTKLAKKLKAKVQVDKNGGLRLTRTKDTPDGKRPGTTIKWVRTGFKRDGRFDSPKEERFVEVEDADAFKAAANSRVEGYGASLFGSGNVTKARKAAMLSGLQRDREARGWEGVPDL